MPGAPAISSSAHCWAAKATPSSNSRSGSPPAASKAASSGAGIEASQRLQIRFVWAKLATGITPARIGTSIPRARAARTKSK